MSGNVTTIATAIPVDWYLANNTYADIIADLGALKFKLATDLDTLMFTNGAGTAFKLMNDASTSANHAAGLLLFTDATGAADAHADMAWDGSTLTVAGTLAANGFLTASGPVTFAQGVTLGDTAVTDDGTIKYAANVFSFRENGAWVTMVDATELATALSDYYTALQVDTWRNGVTQTEMGYVAGVTSDIQTQLNAKPDLSNDANNRVVTATGTGDLNGEANLTFDGSVLTGIVSDAATNDFHRLVYLTRNSSNTVAVGYGLAIDHKVEGYYNDNLSGRIINELIVYNANKDYFGYSIWAGESGNLTEIVQIGQTDNSGTGVYALELKQNIVLPAAWAGDVIEGVSGGIAVAIRPSKAQFIGVETAGPVNTTTETTLLSTTNALGTKTLPANFFNQVGTKIKYSLSGVYNGAGSGETVTIRVKVGGTTRNTFTVGVGFSPVTNEPFKIEGAIHCRSTGGSGSVRCIGSLNKGSGFDVSNIADATVDTTSTLAIDITAQWDAASSSNYVQIYESELEKLDVA